MALSLMWSIALVCTFSIVPATNSRDFINLLLDSHTAAVSTCRGAGHPANSSCCAGLACSSIDLSCYCDRICHQLGDCCGDIQVIGCFENSFSAAQAHHPPTNCSAAGITSGCCTANSTFDCFIPAGNCSCNESCHRMENCCPDIEIIQCQAPPAPPTCIANRHAPDGGCCNPSERECSVDTGSGFCYCDLECHAYGECCEDIEKINCLPRNCAEAGKAFCVVTATEPCSITTPDRVCYCDASCNTGRNDCCSDDPSADIFQVNSRMRMKQLAQLMSSHDQNWQDSRAASLRRRYWAGFLARMQNEMERPDFDPNFPPYYYEKERQQTHG